MVLMTVNAGPRMIEFAYLAMSAELAILEAVDRGHTRMLWLLPPGAAVDFYLGRLHYARLYPLYAALSFATGLYLTAAGFRRATMRRAMPSAWVSFSA